MAKEKKTIKLKKFQQGFYESRARYPGFIAGWATGKTFLMLMRGLAFSRVYKNNLGLIVRRHFTDLRDSTLKDFESYTGLKVPISTKEVTIPGTKSVIMFRHGDELESMQNINLGWFGIEQAEEFDNADGFDMLRGRLRRDLEIDQSYRLGKDYPEFIQWLKDEPRRTGMVIANANGHNWVWRRWIRGIEGSTDYEGHEASTFDNAKNIPPDFVRDLKSLELDNPTKYRRYVLNSHDDMEIEGSFYGRRLDEIQRLGRITDVDFCSDRPVHVVMDPGYHTAMWFFQFRGMDPAFIRCYESVGEGVEGIVALLDQYKKDYGYRYGEFFGPIDIDNNAHRTTHGDTLLEAFRCYGIHIVPLELEKSVMDGIDRTERFLSSCWFDKTGCEVGLDALHRYRLAKNKTMSAEGKPVFQQAPAKGWEAHLSDAFRYASLAVPMATMYDRIGESKTPAPRFIRTPGMF